MSQGDANSTEGGSASGTNPAQTGYGCYRNFDHFPNRHRRSDSSATPCLPSSNEGIPMPSSPSSQRRLLDLAPPDELDLQCMMAPLAQEETMLIPSSPRSYISTGSFKEFVDAEDLMPLPTSDFRNPICLEMRLLKAEDLIGFSENDDVKQRNNGDLGSVDSSDTFATCTTHPFNSQGDLVSPDGPDPFVLDSNLYVNPLDKSGDNSPDGLPPASAPSTACRPGGVKKSASGDTALRSLGTSPMEESFRGFGVLERGSRVSLNDSPVSKHRRTRFQGGRPRTRFDDAFERNSQESLENKKKKTTFLPSRSLVSATRIINQHLFGLQSLGGLKTGKYSDSKSSLSADSIDSRQSPQLEHHRRSKSILKRSEGSGSRNGCDPESERLISDNSSVFDMGSGSEYSPNKRNPSPIARHRAAKNLPSYQQELERTRNLKSQLVPRSQLILLDDVVNNKSRRASPDVTTIEANTLSECVSQVPLYICPPPPPLDGNSPTEESSLLLHSTVVIPSSTTNVQPSNSICKRPRPSS